MVTLLDRFYDGYAHTWNESKKFADQVDQIQRARTGMLLSFPSAHAQEIRFHQFLNHALRPKFEAIAAIDRHMQHAVQASMVLYILELLGDIGGSIGAVCSSDQGPSLTKSPAFQLAVQFAQTQIPRMTRLWEAMVAGRHF